MSTSHKFLSLSRESPFCVIWYGVFLTAQLTSSIIPFLFSTRIRVFGPWPSLHTKTEMELPHFHSFSPYKSYFHMLSCTHFCPIQTKVLTISIHFWKWHRISWIIAFPFYVILSSFVYVLNRIYPCRFCQVFCLVFTCSSNVPRDEKIDTSGGSWETASLSLSLSSEREVVSE